MSRRGTVHVPLGNRQCLNGVRHTRSPFDYLILNQTARTRFNWKSSSTSMNAVMSQGSFAKPRNVGRRKSLRLLDRQRCQRRPSLQATMTTTCQRF